MRANKFGTTHENNIIISQHMNQCHNKAIATMLIRRGTCAIKLCQG